MTTFQEVRMTATKDGVCPVCGKRLVRQKKFYQTVNPFNKNSDGSIKTPVQIQDELKAEIRAWEPDFRHVRCVS